MQTIEGKHLNHITSIDWLGFYIFLMEIKMHLKSIKECFIANDLLLRKLLPAYIIQS